MKKEQCTRSAETKFLRTASKLLRPWDTDGLRLLSYIYQLSRQYNLKDLVPEAILNEAILRGATYINEHEQEIANPSAWLRSTCLNILRNKVRTEQRNRRLSTRVSYSSIEGEGGGLDSIETTEERVFAQEAFTHLSKQDQDIIRLRYIEGLTYKEIQEYLEKHTGILIKLTTLRKRESRAVERLRQLFISSYSADV